MNIAWYLKEKESWEVEIEYPELLGPLMDTELQ